MLFLWKKWYYDTDKRNRSFCMGILKRKLSSFQIILIGFAGVILLGAFLLTLSITSKTHEWTSFIDALFTSTSAVCVTWLIVFDTATHWTIFGQIIILLLIQIGGMSVVTIAMSLAVISDKKSGCSDAKRWKMQFLRQTWAEVVRLTGFNNQRYIFDWTSRRACYDARILYRLRRRRNLVVDFPFRVGVLQCRVRHYGNKKRRVHFHNTLFLATYHQHYDYVADNYRRYRFFGMGSRLQTQVANQKISHAKQSGIDCNRRHYSFRWRNAFCSQRL